MCVFIYVTWLLLTRNENFLVINRSILILLSPCIIHNTSKYMKFSNRMSPNHIHQHLVNRLNFLHINKNLQHIPMTYLKSSKSLYEESVYSPDVDAWSPWLLDTVNRYDEEDDAEDEALDLVHRWCWRDVRLELLLPCSLGLNE